MKLEHAFDPASGTPLSAEREWHPDHDVPCRTPVPHPSVEVDWSAREGTLTNGEKRSEGQGLLGHFRHVARDVREPDPALERAAALELKRLKASNENEIDAFVWLALAERLARKGHWVAWMLEGFVPRCPHCESILKFRGSVFEADAICASSPAEHGRVNDAIRERVASVFHAAFVEDVDCETFVDEFEPAIV